jgi:hypothetical protein
LAQLYRGRNAPANVESVIKEENAKKRAIRFYSPATDDGQLHKVMRVLLSVHLTVLQRLL